MDLLIRAHRVLQKFVDAFGLRPIAQKVFRFLFRIRYGRDGLVTAIQNGRSWRLVPEVALRGELAEFETIEWLRRVVRPGDCVFDIGANVGQMTLEAAFLVGPTGRVIAVEPAPGNVRVLRRHVNGNGFSERVRIFEAACGSQSGGTVTFHIYGNAADSVGSGHSIKKHSNEGESLTITVPVISIDQLATEMPPAVVKIDVEGGELGVLAGAESTLRVYRPAIQIGFHPFAFDDAGDASTVLLNCLERCGYATDHIGSEHLGLEEYQFEPKETTFSK
ncbi:MAG: FkbM family methyltransferase [Planctomycetota bacterium]